MHYNFLLYCCCCCLLGCTLVAVQAYKPGVQYTYQYSSQVVLSELQQHGSKQSAQLTLAANLSLSRLQFSNGVSALRLRFMAASASNGLAPTAQDLRPTESEFLLAAREARSPAWLDSVIAAEDEDPFWLNLARGVASLLRYRDADGAGSSRQADTAGECGLAFAWLNGAGRRQLEKRTEACENVELAGEWNQANPLFAVRRNGGATTVYEFSDDQATPPVSVHSKEAHELLPDLPSGFGLRVSSESRAHLVDASGSESGDVGASFETLSAYLLSIGRPTREVALPTALEFERFDTTGSLSQFLTRLPSYLRDANPSMHALAIVQGLPLARGAKDQMELRKQLEHESNKPYLPDILELYSACGTMPCIGALFDFVAKQLAVLSDDLLERLLLALTQSSRIRRPLLDRTLDLLKRLEAASRWTAARAAYQTLATLGRKFSSTDAGPDSEVPDLLLDRLAGCEVTGVDPAESVDCQLAVLSAMANCPSARYRQPLIRGLLVNATSGSQVTMARLRALQASGPLNSSERQHLASLLRQHYIPLSDPIRYAIAATLGGPAACAEVGIDCRSLRQGSDLWLPLRKRYKQPTSAGHEEVLAGLTSSAFHRGRLLSISDGGNGGGVDYELDMLGNRLGGIRLSEFRLAYAPRAARATPLADILGVRLHADAIDSLLDSSSSGSGGARGGSDDLAEEATAGMQLRVLGEWLRPRRFFTGTSGLMSAVWNAPESPVSVLQSSFLLHDFATRVHLLNGLVVQATISGALALNVSGSLSVSIWNRDAASKVLNSIGLVMYANAGLRTGRFSVDLVSQAQAELLNTVATFVSFAETPVRTCLVMSNSPAAVTQNCHVTDTIGPRYDHHSHEFYVPGRSFSLGDRNDRLCKELALDSDDE